MWAYDDFGNGVNNITGFLDWWEGVLFGLVGCPFELDAKLNFTLLRVFSRIITFLPPLTPQKLNSFNKS